MGINNNVNFRREIYNSSISENCHSKGLKPLPAKRDLSIFSKNDNMTNAIATQNPNSVFDKIGEDFAGYDKDGDNKISYDEYLFGQMDINGDGEITYDEFQKFMNPDATKEEPVMGEEEGAAEGTEDVTEEEATPSQAAIQQFDQDGDGKLNDVELEEYINIQKYDLNGDGEVTHDEKQSVINQERLERYDSNGDGKISDFEAFFGAIRDKFASFGKEMDRVKYDINDDGKVSDSEYAIGKFDKDGDLKLSEEEMEEYMNESTKE